MDHMGSGRTIEFLIRHAALRALEMPKIRADSQCNGDVMSRQIFSGHARENMGFSVCQDETSFLLNPRL